MFGDPQGDPGWVVAPSRRSVTGRGTLREIQDGLGDRLGGLRQVEKSSGRSGMGRKILPGGPGLIRRPSQGSETDGGAIGRSETGGEVLPEAWDGLETLPEVRDRSRDPP